MTASWQAFWANQFGDWAPVPPVPRVPPAIATYAVATRAIAGGYLPVGQEPPAVVEVWGFIQM